MKLKAPVKGIFFDLGWTLLAPVSGSWMFSAFARQYFPEDIMASLPRERVRAAMERGQEYLNTHHLMSTIQEEYQAFKTYFTILAKDLPELGLSEGDIKAVAEEKAYKQVDNFYLFDGALETLDALKGKYKLGIISDTWPSIEPALERFGLTPYFDCATFSYTLGVYKPAPRMYKDALSKMGLPPAQTIFIDDFTGNLEGAREAGIQPVLIQAKPGAEDREDMAKIKRIGELLSILP